MEAAPQLTAPRPGGTFASLRLHRNYRLYFVGQTISASGSLMQDSALPWLVLQRTHSPFLVGVLVFCRYAPLATLGLYGGVIADRFNNRTILLVTQGAAMAVAVTLTVLAFSGLTPVWAICSLAILSGLTLAFDNPSKNALVYQLVGPAELANAVSLNLSVQNIARILGPALGGVVIVAFGVGWCFALNALSFVAVLAGLWFMRPNELFSLQRLGEQLPALRALREGLLYVRRSRDLQILVGLAVVGGFCGFSAVRTLLPDLAARTLHGGARTFGVIYACYGLGAVAGGLISARLARLSWRRLLLGAGMFSGAMLLLAPMRVAIVVGVLLMLIGASWTTWSSQSQSIIQLTAPDHLRGRVISVYNSALFMGIPFGGLAGGWLAERGGTQLAFSVAGAAGVGSVGVACILRGRSS
jgi:MFS family permease